MSGPLDALWMDRGVARAVAVGSPRATAMGLGAALVAVVVALSWHGSGRVCGAAWWEGAGAEPPHDGGAAAATDGPSTGPPGPVEAASGRVALSVPALLDGFEAVAPARPGSSAVDSVGRALDLALALAEEHPLAVLGLSEALVELSARRGVRPIELAGLADAAAARSSGGPGGRLLDLLRLGRDEFADRDARLRALRDAEDASLPAGHRAAGLVVAARVLVAQSRGAEASEALARARDAALLAALDAEGSGARGVLADAVMEVLRLLGRDAEVVREGLSALPRERAGVDGPGGGEAWDDASRAEVAERLTRAGLAASRLGDDGLATLLFSGARDAEPGRHDRHERLIWHLLRDPRSMVELAPRSPLGRAVRLLRQHHPESPLLEHIVLVQAMRRGQGALVLDALERLGERAPSDERIHADLVGVRMSLGQSERARSQVERRLAELPSTAAAEELVLLSRVMQAMGDPFEARRRLGTWIDEHHDDPVVLAELERLFSSPPFSRSEMMEMRRRRLDAEPPTASALLERAELMADGGAWPASVEPLLSMLEQLERAVALDDVVPGWLAGVPASIGPSLAPGQRASALRVITTLMQRAWREVPAERVAELLDRADAVIGPLPERLDRSRLDAAIASGRGVEAVAELAERLGAASRERRRAAFDHLARELGPVGDQDNGFVVALRQSPEAVLVMVRRAALRDGMAPDPDDFRRWFASVYEGSFSESMTAERAAMLRASLADGVLAARDAGVLARGVEMFGARLSDRGPAEGSAALARLVDPDRHWDAAVALFEVGLSFDPGHASLNNSYGYNLLERGERLEFAGERILAALRSAPDDPNIIDSMGWARYRLGVLQDRPREAGAGDGAVGAGVEPFDSLEVLGAVSLLRRAAAAFELPPMYEPGADGAPPELPPLDEIPGAHIDAMIARPTVLEHLGCALWAVGDRDGAIEAWESALRAAIVGRAAAGLLSPILAMQTEQVVREVDRVALAVRGYLDAVSEGAPPPIPSHDPMIPSQGPDPVDASAEPTARTPA